LLLRKHRWASRSRNGDAVGLTVGLVVAVALAVAVDLGPVFPDGTGE
jgi:hypothetical protein